MQRREAAAAALGADPPQARPSIDNCRYCTVRHLCDEYWQPATLKALTAAAPNESAVTDLQITIVARHGPSSWDGILEQSRGPASGRPIVLRTKAGSELEFVKGDRIRVLDAYLAPIAGDDASPLVATIGSMSEIFTL
jgi:hypothetical protein